MAGLIRAKKANRYRQTPLWMINMPLTNLARKSALSESTNSVPKAMNATALQVTEPEGLLFSTEVAIDASESGPQPAGIQPCSELSSGAKAALAAALTHYKEAGPHMTFGPVA